MHQPILQPPRPNNVSRIRSGRTSRYLCLAFILTITILYLTLTRMSVLSNRQLELDPTLRPAPIRAWEEFSSLERYYGGLRTLVSRPANVPEWPRASDETPLSGDVLRSSREGYSNTSSAQSTAFSPYPDYASSEYLAEFFPVEDCTINTSLGQGIPNVRAYAGVPRGFPDPAMGSHQVLGLRDDVCFERYGRLGPYGYGYGMRSGGTGSGLHGDRDGAEAVWAERRPVNFKGVRWAGLQERCLRINAHRFRRERKPSTDGGRSSVGDLRIRSTDPHSKDSIDRKSEAEEKDELGHPPGNDSAIDNSSKKRLPRTAFIVRLWSSFQHTTESIMFLRSLISELTLFSGGEYTIHILVHVQDDNLQIWANEDLYQQVLRDALPEEFRGLGTLWTERQMGLLYGGLEESFYRHLPVHGVYRSSFMPVQWFAQQHPEYEHFWHWEMDARFTGHYYHLLDRVTRWAREQPRKELWERSGRFYVPSEHGSWEDFRQMVRVQTRMSVNNPSPDNKWNAIGGTGRLQTGEGSGSSGRKGPVWGPERAAGDERDDRHDIIPPTSLDQDRYQWGVGEEADLITFNPLFDPDGTTWILSEDVTGYNTSTGLPPRRGSVITVARLSRRLLQTMHDDTSMRRRTMFSEMWPASCALQHGLKAVAVPHGVYLDRAWPSSYLASTFNGGRDGATGGARTSVFGDRQHNFRGSTWYYNAAFSSALYRRWLGFRVAGQGGEQAEEAGEGRMCLPGILLHPIKEIGLIIEGSEV